MQEANEKDDIGRYFKEKFDTLEDAPELDLKDQLFDRMDMLEGKRSKTVYLHFNVFGMKVAASLTMVIVSSLAMMAVAAVTFLAIKNNQRLPKNQQNIEEFQQKEQKTTESKSSKKFDKKIEGLKTEEKEYIRQVIEEISTQKRIENTEKPAEIEKPKEVIPAAPIDKNGDNKKLLKELEEEELFKGN
jgi:septal ring factor EnvC (AmiA/AmiB activator)